MDISLKRIVAFAIDILLVTFVVTLLTKYTPIDPYKEKYENAYNEFVELVNEANEDKENIDIYEDRIMELNYNVYEYRIVSSTIFIIAIVLYFAVFQLVLNGQTIGKKIMNIQVISNKDKKLNIGNYLIRVLILNNVIFTIIGIIAVYFVSGKNFYYVTYMLGLLESIIYMVNVFMIVFRKDNRGLHDMLAGTKVIDMKHDVVEEEVVEEKKTIEVKPKKKKTN